MLFAANHISYIDITVLGSLIPGSFIAKAEVARWPLFGWLAKLQRSRLCRPAGAQHRQPARQRSPTRLAARRCADPVSGRNERRRQPRAPVQERAVQRRRARGDGVPGDRAAGLARLYAPRRHADRPALPAVLRLVRRDGDGAPSVEHAGPRDGRGRRRVSPADDARRLRLAQGAGRAIARSGSPAGSPRALCGRRAADAAPAAEPVSPARPLSAPMPPHAAPDDANCRSPRNARRRT